MSEPVVVNKEKVAILFSGGSDSTLLLKFAEALNYDVTAVLIDYGQLHVEELAYAVKYCGDNNIQYKKITLSGYDVKSGLTTGEKGLYENVHQSNVPARNSIMLSLAAGIAESIGASKVQIGCDMDDYYGKFPDCMQHYIGQLNNVFKIAFNKPIIIEAPLLGFSKKMVLDILEKLYNIKAEDLYTGYREFA